MEAKEMSAQKIRSKYYDQIIQVNVPVRFYWAEGEFDGIEFGPFQKPVPRYQVRLIYEALAEIMEIMETEPKIDNVRLPQRKARQEKPIKIPQVYIDAFREKK